LSRIILDMENISKEFPGVKALDNVCFQVEEFQIHALVGENGAGKSTLMNVLSGIYPFGSYQGKIIFNGEECRFKNVNESGEAGIGFIHQELALIPYLSIAENIFLGNEVKTNGSIDWDQAHIKAEALLKKVGLSLNTFKLIKDIGVGEQQLVEIAKALSRKVKLLILDEPTAALNEIDSNTLLNLLIELKKEGVTSIIISHKLDEVTRIADKITILRDGTTIETLTKSNEEFSKSRIIKGMVGRELKDIYPKREKNIADVKLEIRNWNAYDPTNEDRKVLHDISINARKGEIVGIAGLMGAGRTEFALSLFGRSYGKKISGKVLKDGKEIDVSSVPKAIKNGIAYATEDRKVAGLILIDNVKNNITLSSLRQISKHNLLDENNEIRLAEMQKAALNIKCSSVFQRTMDLSGGNQQKVVLSKWILANPEILVLDEPTRGIDVGAKFEIYTIINKLACEGKTVIMISSEMPELLGICDRIYIMNKGRIVGEQLGCEASQESIMECIMGNNMEVN